MCSYPASSLLCCVWVCFAYYGDGSTTNCARTAFGTRVELTSKREAVFECLLRPPIADIAGRTDQKTLGGSASKDGLLSWRERRCFLQRQGFHREDIGCRATSDAGASLRPSGPHSPRRTKGSSRRQSAASGARTRVPIQGVRRSGHAALSQNSRRR